MMHNQEPRQIPPVISLVKKLLYLRRILSGKVRTSCAGEVGLNGFQIKLRYSSGASVSSQRKQITAAVSPIKIIASIKNISRDSLCRPLRYYRRFDT